MYNILYVTLGCGQFLAQLITANLEKNPQGFEKYANADVKWQSREDSFKINDKINVSHTKNFTLEEIDKMENVVFISTNTENDKTILDQRNKFIDGAMRNIEIWKCRTDFHDDVFYFLKRLNKNFYDLPLSKLFDAKNFLQTFKDVAKFLNIEVDEKITQDAYTQWIKTNMRLMAK